MSAEHTIVCPEKGIFLVVQFLEKAEFAAFLRLLEKQGYEIGFEKDYTLGTDAVAFHKIEALDNLKAEVLDYCKERLSSGRACVIAQITPWAIRAARTSSVQERR